MDPGATFPIVDPGHPGGLPCMHLISVSPLAGCQNLISHVECRVESPKQAQVSSPSDLVSRSASGGGVNLGLGDSVTTCYEVTTHTIGITSFAKLTFATNLLANKPGVNNLQA